MIFFGSRGKMVSGEVIEGIPCPNCGNHQFITFGVIRYFHLYWIPTFPTSKTVGIECTHCKRTLIDKELPPELAKQIKTRVFNKKNTLSTFSGLIIIACLILFGALAAQRDNMKEASYIEQPAVNDLYIVDFTKIFTNSDKEYKYGLMRIKQVSADQVIFQVSKIAYNSTSGVRKDIREKKSWYDSYYDTKILNIDIDKLKSLKNTGAFFSIERIQH